MATAKWASPSALGSDIAGSALNSLADNATSAFVTYDNSTNLDLYAFVVIVLGSFTSLTGASITLRVFPSAGTAPDNTGSVGGGESYTVPITVGASAKRMVIPIRLYPCSMRIAISNTAGAAFAGSGNTIKVQPYNESVA